MVAGGGQGDSAWIRSLRAQAGRRRIAEAGTGAGQPIHARQHTPVPDAGIPRQYILLKPDARSPMVPSTVYSVEV